MKYAETLNNLYLSNLEKEWQKSSIRYSERQWVGVFPEAKEIIREIIKGFEKEEQEILSTIQENLTLIRSQISGISLYFWREWVKCSQVSRLIEIEKKIAGLRAAISEGKAFKGEKNHRINDEDIYQALQTSIIDVAIPSLNQARQLGENYLSLCPFHKENHPSFYLYALTNSFYCFGCGVGGNVINLVMKLHNLPFKEAVRFLLRGQL